MSIETSECFECYICGDEYFRTSVNVHSDDDHDCVSLCDGCYAEFTRMANIKGIPLNSLGGLDLSQ